MKFRFRLLENILNEDIAAVKKQYPNMSDDLFMKLIAFDPTYNPNRDSVGTYGKWILNNYNKGNITDSDFGHLKDALSRLEDNKSKLIQKDIGKYKTLDELDAMLNDENSYKELSHRQEVKQRQKARKSADLDEEASLVYEDDEWEIWVPHTYAASCKLGQGARWCTASTETDYYYNMYKEEYGGEYYILINKTDPANKLQFHFESGQFMNKNDAPIDLHHFMYKYPKIAEALKEPIRNGVYAEFEEKAKEYNINEDGQGYVIVDADTMADLIDEYGNTDMPKDFIEAVLGGNLFEEIQGWDFSYYEYSYGIDAVENLDDDFISGYGIDLTKQDIIDALERVSDGEGEEEDDDIAMCVRRAYYNGNELGSEDEIYRSFIRELEANYGVSKVELGVPNEGSLRITVDINRIVSPLLGDMANNFSLYEPRYGWNGFSEEAFRNTLIDELSLIF